MSKEIIGKFNQIERKIDRLMLVAEASNTSSSGAGTEIIDRQELSRRLDVTEQHIINLEKKGEIVSFRVGAAVRYNWPQVLTALQTKK